MNRLTDVEVGQLARSLGAQMDDDRSRAEVEVPVDRDLELGTAQDVRGRIWLVLDDEGYSLVENMVWLGSQGDSPRQWLMVEAI